MKFTLSHRTSHLPRSGWLGAIATSLTRKVWLPKFLYEGLPYFYASAGIASIASTLFVTGWYWVLPFCWLLGLMCLHGALTVWRIRRYYRLKHKADIQDHQTGTQADA